MINDVKVLLDKIEIDIKDFSNIIYNNELNNNDINYKVKHILEDMQSVLDYIAVDIHNRFCPNHGLKKIYFIYSKEDEYELDFRNKINSFFPGLNKDICDEMTKVQWFYDNSNWLLKLVNLTNEVKHNRLYILRVEKEKNILIKNCDSSLLIKGNFDVQKYQNGYGMFNESSLYLSDKCNFSCHDDGTITLGNGSYNISNGNVNNLDYYMNYKNIVKSKKYDEDIICMLNLIYKKESQFVSNLEKVM